LPKLVNELSSQDRWYVPIIDIGIPVNKTDQFYKRGMELNTFIISNYTKNPLIHVVWPGKCHFPDWFNPNATQFWHEGLKELNSYLDFDGIWQDMNEPSSDYDYGRGKGELDANLTETEKNEYNNIPYIPGNYESDLVSRAISVNAYNYGDEKLMRVYNTKPLTSFMQSLNTYNYLKLIGKRPFILSRSNVIGLGRYAIHWLGDNYSTYESMKLSLAGIFNFQMFGFSMMGADVCGFNNNSTDTLCARWHTLGAFYPFARNHNNRDNKSKEPYAVGELTLKSVKLALSYRYSLIRYLYTELFFISLNGGTFFKPLFFEFPEDSELFERIEESFMFGKAFLMIPIYSDKEDSIISYFPNANWNNFPSGKNIVNYNNTVGGVEVILNGSFDVIHLYMRGGQIIPRQETLNPRVLTTNQLRRIPTEIIINPDQNNYAEGEIIFDDGYLPNVIEDKDYFQVKIFFNYNAITFKRINKLHSIYKYNDINISKIVIFRSEYLKYTTAEIKYKSNNTIYIPLEIEGENITIDISKYNISFEKIKNVLLLERNHISFMSPLEIAQ
jgi:alpha-glucosidase (family GH31 glycosyl hydrolase)